MQMQLLSSPFTIFKLLILTLLLQVIPTLTLSPCKTTCGSIPINYPFGLEDGCGAPQFRHMLNCSTDLFFQTPSGSYKVQSIDYDKKTMVIYDPSLSTCSILQPHHDFQMTDVQSAIIPPSQDTVFVLLNCSIDSPVLNHYKYLCFNFAGHTCDELYGSCNAFRVFHLLTNSSPPCCFTSYSTVKFMSMNILDCTHYTSMFNTDNLKVLALWTGFMGSSFLSVCLILDVKVAENLVGPVGLILIQKVCYVFAQVSLIQQGNVLLEA
uniref:Wall-associated receptor kinase galacturonan-binding domain-containing protein n=1 Tax=Glycine max TaxID=3847 RepID=C6TFA5_SOYBN|nr:unknown [Glycine max]